MSDLKKRFSRRDFLRVAGGTAATMPLLAACASETEAPVAAVDCPDVGEMVGPLHWLPPEEPELKDVVVGVNTPSWFTNLIWRTCLDRGFFEEEGFDNYELIVADGAFEGLVGGDITVVVNMDYDEVMVSVNEGVPIIGLATHRDHEWHIGGLAPEIKKPTDLIGGIGMVGSPGTRTFAQYQQNILNWSGGEVDIERDMEHIKISGGSDARQLALISSQAQVANIYTRHLTGLKEAGCLWHVFGWYDWPQESITVRQDTADQYPRTCVNLMRAFLKGLMIARNWNEKGQMKADMAANHDMPLSDEFDLAWTSQIDAYCPDFALRPQAMKFFLDDLAKYDVISADVKYEDFIDTSFLSKAQTELYGLSWPPPKQNDFFTNTGSALRPI